MKTMEVVFAPIGEKRARKSELVRKTIQLRGKVTHPSINRAMDRVQEQMRKKGNFYLKDYSPVETDEVEEGYCPKCRKRVKYNRWYGGMFDSKYDPKCPKGHKLLSGGHQCYECKRGKMWQVSSRRVGPECVVMHFRCDTCGAEDTDVLD